MSLGLVLVIVLSVFLLRGVSARFVGGAALAIVVSATSDPCRSSS